MIHLALETRPARALLSLLVLSAPLVLVGACGKDDKKDAARPPLEVTALTIVAARTCRSRSVFVAQTQSSQAVNIEARVSGFLDKRVYTEGAVVKAGQVLFQMDQKPFQAQVDGQAAALQRNQAALEVATANLDADQAARRAERAVAEGSRRRAGPVRAGAGRRRAGRRPSSRRRSSTSRTRRSRSPVDGVSSFAAVADGTYVNPQNSQLTTVSVLTPMWINFSISENEMQRIRNQVQQGLLRLPENNQFVVEIELVDGTLFPYKGKITFADPSYNSQTGTFLIRASVDNPKGVLRPNQYVRTRLHRRDPAERHPRSAARRAAGREGPLRLGRQQGQQGRAAAGRRRRLVRRELVHRAGPRGRRPGRRRRRAAARAGRSRQGDGLHAEAGVAGSRGAARARRGDADRQLRERQGDARRRGDPAPRRASRRA